MLRILSLPVHLTEKVGKGQLSVPWESAAGITRRTELPIQEQLVVALLAGTTRQKIRRRIQEQVRKGARIPASRARESKPSITFSTSHQATVVVVDECDEP